jgi:hypothetical protein
MDTFCDEHEDFRYFDEKCDIAHDREKYSYSDDLLEKAKECSFYMSYPPEGEVIENYQEYLYSQKLSTGKKDIEIDLECFRGNPLFDPENWYSIRFNDYVDLISKLFLETTIRSSVFDCIRMFHRHPECYVSLLRKEDGLKPVGSVVVADFDKEFSRLKQDHSELVENDLYFTVNTYYTAEKKWRRVKNSGLYYPRRKEKNLQYLNACYVDIDVGRSEDENEKKRYTDYQALWMVLVLESVGVIPQCSVYARSGRGLYLFWIIKSTRAFPENLQLYKVINKTLANKISEFVFADPVAIDGARVLRVYGSYHSTAGEMVNYWPSFMEEDCVDEAERALPSLDSLAQELNVSIKNPVAPVKINKMKQALNPGSVPSRVNGPKACADNRLRDLLKIENHKGGFKQGKRYTSIKLAIRFMKDLGMDKRTVLKYSEELAQRCNPPYPTEEESNDVPVQNIVNDVYKGKSGLPAIFKNDYLANFFEVDDKVAESLDLKSIMPESIRKARFKPYAEIIKERRNTIVKAVWAIGEDYTHKAVVQYLAGEGVNVSRTTVLNDLKILEKEKLIPLHRKPGRPPKFSIIQLNNYHKQTA